MGITLTFNALIVINHYSWGTHAWQKKRKNKFGTWLYRIGFTILVLISLGLILNQQIKNWLVTSYQPEITQKSVKKNEKKEG